jgi:hypothetical protein
MLLPLLLLYLPFLTWVVPLDLQLHLFTSVTGIAFNIAMHINIASMPTTT